MTFKTADSVAVKYSYARIIVASDPSHRYSCEIAPEIIAARLLFHRHGYFYNLILGVRSFNRARREEIKAGASSESACAPKRYYALRNTIPREDWG